MTWISSVAKLTNLPTDFLVNTLIEFCLLNNCGEVRRGHGGLVDLSNELERLEAWSEAEKELVSKRFQGVMVSLSGGPDSTALFHLIWRLAKQKKNFQVAVLHLDYGLRGAASSGDQAYCRELAERHGVAFHGRVVSKEERELRHGESTQAWARRLRREEFQRYSAAGWLIALGHHQGDLAENVLLRLARGASPGHLLGMRAWRSPLWRPLLGFTKAELLQYLSTHALSYREDASNQTLHYSRNIVRHRVLTELEAMFPGAARRIIACAEEARSLAETHHRASSTRGGSLALDDLARKDPALARQDLATLLDSPTQDPRPLSRRFLASVLANGAAAGCRVSSIPGGGRLSYRDGRLRVHMDGDLPKAARSAQHRRSLVSTPPAVLLDRGSYAFFRQDGGCLRFSHPADAVLGEGPARLRLRLAGSTQSLNFYGLKRSFKLKELLRQWAVPLALRPAYQLLEVQGQLIGLWSGSGLYQPNAAAQQTECSQAGLNLRYLKDGV